MPGPQPYAVTLSRVAATVPRAGHTRLLLCSSSMLPAELFHKVDQLVDALGRHGVVDGRTHTAHQTVTLQVDETCLGAAAQNALSVSASGLVKVTFIMLRYFFSTGFL